MEIGLRHFSTLGTGLLVAKNQKKSNDRKYDNFCPRQTDRLTDGRAWIHRTRVRVQKTYCKHRHTETFIPEYEPSFEQTVV